MLAFDNVTSTVSLKRGKMGKKQEMSNPGALDWLRWVPEGSAAIWRFGERPPSPIPRRLSDTGLPPPIRAVTPPPTTSSATGGSKRQRSQSLPGVLDGLDMALAVADNPEEDFEVRSISYPLHSLINQDELLESMETVLAHVTIS